ncbi:MAG TPA: RimK family alpha-L-glutamate ligase [Oscillospiraceae bacterium]|nr:RimK family alpha-L-glutamate ligase [Oscillospiraceae bacterium]
MKHFIITGSKPGFHTKQLLSAFRRLGAKATFIRIDELTFDAHSSGLPDAFIECDGIVIRSIPGGSLEQIIYRMDALYTLERRDIVCLNSPKVIEKTVDKYYSLSLLAEHGLPVPPTVVTEKFDMAMTAFFNLGSDVVYKPIFGSGGKGMLHISDTELAEQTFRELSDNGSVLYLQKFIPCSNQDIRVFVLGGKVLAAMRRIGIEWRANCSLGGRPESYKLSSSEERIALEAASAIGTEMAGVDLLPADDGKVYISEINGSPAWWGLSQVSDVDIPKEIALYMLRKTK